MKPVMFDAMSMIRVHVANARKLHHCYCWAKRQAETWERSHMPATARWYWHMAKRFQDQRDDSWASARAIKPKQRRAA